MKIRTTVLGLLATVVTALPVAAQQQDALDGRWLPYVGCWEAVGAEEEIGLLCFQTEDDGVTLTNWVAGTVSSTERLVADGQQRPVLVEGCEGWETVEFSSDGRRAFTRTEFTCGDQSARTGTGVMTFTAPNRWADVRQLDMDGEPVAWVQEYQLVGVDRLGEAGIDDPADGRSMAVRSARMAAAAPIDLSDVEEAIDRMGSRAVETWIVAQRDRLDPDGGDLVRLADAGASDAVIDAVVAVSNPDRFVVDRSGPIEEMDVPVPTHYRGYMAFNPFYGPAWGLGVGWAYSPFWYGYDPFWYGYGPGWGYPGYGYGYGYGYWGTRPGYVVIDRRSGDGGTVYRNRGYTQGGTRGDARTARPRGSSGPTYSRGGDSGGAASAAPQRRGSDGRASTGRTARRRGGGR